MSALGQKATSGLHPRMSVMARKRPEQVQRKRQRASTSRHKTHQAKADSAPRFRQCLTIAPRSSTCRVELHWRLGLGADHGRTARIARPGTGQQRRARRRGLQSQAYVFNVFGWLAEAARSWYPSLRALWLGPSWPCVLDRYTQSALNVVRKCQKKRSRRRNRKPN